MTLTDGALNYVAGTAALGIEASAYTNNDLDALTATTLFNLDATLDQISIQSPPNNGVLVATGKLQLDAGAIAGYDIYSELEDGVTRSNRGFAVINVEGVAPSIASMRLPVQPKWVAASATQSWTSQCR